MAIAAVILTKNEARHLRRCLDSLKGWISEIIIVDDQSTDATKAIAAGEYAARVIEHPLNNNFDQQRNLGIDACQQEWVLQMDADEVISPAAARAIEQAVAQGENDAYELLRQDCVWTTPLKYVGGCYQLKLFRKSKGRYAGAIHEALRIDGKIGRINLPVWHYPIPSVSAMIAKHNFYTDLECAKFFKENPQVDIRTLKKNLIFKPAKIFFKHYIKHKGYKDGIPGLIWSAIHTLHPMMFWMKAVEFKARLSGESDENRG